MANDFEDRLNEIRNNGIKVFCDDLNEKNKFFTTGEVERMYNHGIREIITRMPNYEKRLDKGLSCINTLGNIKKEMYYENYGLCNIHTILFSNNSENLIYNFLEE
jgi:hypothetical protein